MTNDEKAKTRAEVVRLYEVEKLSMHQIAARFNVTYRAVHVRLVRAGIERRPRKWPVHRSLLDRQTLHHLYVEQGLPVYKIAKQLKVDFKTVVRALAEYSIERRPRGHWVRIKCEIDNLEVGESALIFFKSAKPPYVRYYCAAKIRNIKISIRRAGPERIRVTRVE